MRMPFVFMWMVCVTSGDRPIGATNGKQTKSMASCRPSPPPPAPPPAASNGRQQQLHSERKYWGQREVRQGTGHFGLRH